MASANLDSFRSIYQERVLALVHFSGYGKTSTLELGQLRAQGATRFNVGEGKVTRIVIYWDLERAVGDLGLPPETGSPGS